MSSILNENSQMVYIAMIKPTTGLSWRQYLKLDRIDPCGITAGLDNIQFLKASKDYYFEKFPQMPKKCPIESGKYYANNVTIVNNIDLNFTRPEETSQFLGPSFPNGVYRHVLRMFTDKDPVGFTLYWHIDRYDSMGEDRF